jgi:crotonobetainyl-CoA:carnitine CoA-transferase CaiB-like acyl-CoA transferase
VTYSLVQGLKVLEVGRLVSAPYCSKLLASLGAAVIKAEETFSNRRTTLRRGGNER